MQVCKERDFQRHARITGAYQLPYSVYNLQKNKQTNKNNLPYSVVSILLILKATEKGKKPTSKLDL